MATFQATKKALSVPPTVRTLPSGVPAAPSLLNLRARAPADAHGHDHGHGAAGPRTDAIPKWAGGMNLGAYKSYVSGAYFSNLHAATA